MSTKRAFRKLSEYYNQGNSVGAKNIYFVLFILIVFPPLTSHLAHRLASSSLVMVRVLDQTATRAAATTRAEEEERPALRNRDQSETSIQVT